MSLPETITVTGTYNDLEGNALPGRVIFQVEQPVEDPDGNVIFSETPIVADLVDGSFSEVLPCTDTDGLSPINFYYTVTEQVSGISRSYGVQLPHTLGASVDLSALAPASPAPLSSAFLTANTWKATQTFSGSPPIIVTGYLAPAVVTLSQVSGIVTVNAILGNDFRLTLTASGWTIASPANPSDGQIIEFAFAQDADGDHTVSWGNSYDFGINGAPALSTAPYKVDLIGFKYHGGLSKWLCLGAGLGY